MTGPVIRSVFLFPNGNLAVCDQHGQQMPEYQHPNAGPKVARDAPTDGTVEWNGCTREGLRQRTSEFTHADAMHALDGMDDCLRCGDRHYDPDYCPPKRGEKGDA